MAPGAYTGAAGGVHLNRHFRQKSLDYQGVGDDAHVGAETDECDGSDGFLFIHLQQHPPQLHRAEARLVHRLRFPQSVQLRAYLPALSALYAVGHGQVFALLGLHVIFRMGVPGEYHRAAEGCYLLLYPGHYGHGLLGAQGTVNEVVLHVYDYEYILHDCPLLCQ